MLLWFMEVSFSPTFASHKENSHFFCRIMRNGGVVCKKNPKKSLKREERPGTQWGRERIPGEWDEWDGEHSTDPFEKGKG